MKLSEAQSEVLTEIRKYIKPGVLFIPTLFYPGRTAADSGKRRIIRGALVKLGYVEEVVMENTSIAYRLTEMTKI